MKSALVFLLTVIALTHNLGHAAESEISHSAPQSQAVSLRWLCTAGWRIQFAQKTILIDPFLTRKQSVPDEEWQTDEVAVLRVINAAD